MELDFIGRSGEVLAEQFAEDGARGDVGVAIAVESEAIGAGVFVGRKARLPSDRGKALGVVREAPDVDLARGQAWERTGRGRPVGGDGHGGILCQVEGRWRREKHFPYPAPGLVFTAVFVCKPIDIS